MIPLSPAGERWTKAHARAPYAEGLTRKTVHARLHKYDWQPKSLADAKRVNGYAAVAEAQVAFVTGRTWLSRGQAPDGKRPDVDGGIHVRHTQDPGGHLLVQFDDLEPYVYVIVVGAGFPLRIAGWQTGSFCQQPQWWKNKGDRLKGGIVRCGAWFVPQRELLDRGDRYAVLERLIVQPGDDPTRLLDYLNDPQWLVRWVGRTAFGIAYDREGRAIS